MTTTPIKRSVTITAIAASMLGGVGAGAATGDDTGAHDDVVVSIPAVETIHLARSRAAAVNMVVAAARADDVAALRAAQHIIAGRALQDRVAGRKAVSRQLRAPLGLT